MINKTKETYNYNQVNHQQRNIKKQRQKLYHDQQQHQRETLSVVKQLHATDSSFCCYSFETASSIAVK